METFLNFLIGLFNDDTNARFIIIGLVATTVFSITLAVYFLFSNLLDPVRKRLYSITDSNQSVTKKNSSHITNISNTLHPKSKKNSYNHLRLLYAGFHTENAYSTFIAIRITLIVSLPLISFAIMFYFAAAQKLILLALTAAAIIGYILPSLLLDKAVTKRQKEVRNTFPDVIDQLIISTEAGLGVEAGLQRVAKNLAISSSVMSYEINLVNAELRAGIPRQDAFNNLVIRTGVEEIKGFVSALAQSIRFGTNIADTMRVYADDLRDRRMQKAEEAAAKIGLKMLFPLVFCFFPGIFIVIVGPAAIIIMNNFISR